MSVAGDRKRSRSHTPEDVGSPARAKKDRKFRTPQACDRCHRRKQRCDGNAQCQPCQQAGVECTTTDKTSQRTVTRSHLPELEERIQWLEGLINQSQPTLNIHMIPTDTDVQMSAVPPRPLVSYLTDPPAQQTGPAMRYSSTDLNKLSFPEELEPKGNLFLDPSLESGDSYIPPTAQSLYGRFARNHAFEEPPQHITPATRVFASIIRSSSQTPAPALHPPKYPPFATAKRYCDLFFHHNHTQAPFLHHASFQQRFVAFYSTDFIDQQPHWIFIFNLVLAIGQTTLYRQEALQGKIQQASREDRFFETAMEVLEQSVNRTSITTIQCLLLLATYGLQHPQAVSIYRIVAQSMRICIELSLHRTQNHKPGLTPLDREMRKRIFWSAYSLDRFASVSLGRPCSIADDCISCELPLDIDDAGLQSNNPVALPPGSTSEMTFSLSIFKLRRISGRIIQMLYCSTQSSQNQNVLVDRFVMELEAWRLTIPASEREFHVECIVPSVFRSSSWYNLGYWHARMLLYRLLAPGGSPHDLRHCAEAAIQSVKLYARLLDELRININWSTLALCFTAGVTLLWCVWLAPKSSLEPAISMAQVQEAIQCTEKVLAALGDIWPTARRCGDLYKDLCQNVVVTEQDGAIQGISNNVMDHLESTTAVDEFNTNFQYHGIENVLPPGINNGDSVEAFEQLGWTLGGFQV